MSGQNRTVAWLLLALAVLAVLGGGGCNTVRVRLRAEADTNQGRPLQVLVRALDEQTYRTESYAAVSRLVIAPDDSVLRKLVIAPQPRYRRSLCVSVPAGRPLALYFLYTAPTGHWKMLLLPRLPWAVTVPLRRSGIAVEDVQESRFLRPADAAPPTRPGAPEPAGGSSGPPSLPSLPTAPSPPSAPSLPSAPSPPPAPSLPDLPTPPAPPAPPGLSQAPAPPHPERA